jgi:hypothetical protein
MEMCWLSVLCGDVDHGSQFAETITVNWALDSLGGLHLRLKCKVWSLVRRKQTHALACIVSNIDRAAASHCNEPMGKSPGFGP